MYLWVGTIGRAFDGIGMFRAAFSRLIRGFRVSWLTEWKVWSAWRSSGKETADREVVRCLITTANEWREWHRGGGPWLSHAVVPNVFRRRLGRGQKPPQHMGVRRARARGRVSFLSPTHGEYLSEFRRVGASVAGRIHDRRLCAGDG